MKCAILGHQTPDVDSILSGILLERILNRLNKATDDYRFVIPDNTVDAITTNILRKLNIDVEKYQSRKINPEDSIMLVDHYDDARVQDREIVAIFDHHPPTTGFATREETETYMNYQSSSTTLVLAKEFENLLTKEDFILVLVGALVDTASFKSSKTIPNEVDYLKRKCEEFGINISAYYDMGLCLNELKDLGKDCLYGLKKYTLCGKKVQSSSVQLKDVEKNKSSIDQMIELLKEYIKEESLYAFIFLVHDMDEFKTTEYDIYSDHVECTRWDGYTSRGSTIIPNFDKKLATQIAK